MSTTQIPGALSRRTVSSQVMAGGTIPGLLQKKRWKRQNEVGERRCGPLLAYGRDADRARSWSLYRSYGLRCKNSRIDSSQNGINGRRRAGHFDNHRFARLVNAARRHSNRGVLGTAWGTG